MSTLISTPIQAQMICENTLTLREELAEKTIVVIVVYVSVAPEERGWRTLRHGDTLLVGRLVQELVGVVLIAWRNQQDPPVM